MVGCETGMEIDRPLARDVVRYFDVAYLATPEIRGNNVIGVNVPRRGLATSNTMNSVTYHSPRCKSPTAFGRTKQCRAQTALTTPLAM